VLWLGVDADRSNLAIIASIVWKVIGFGMILFVGAIQAIPTEITEAALQPLLVRWSVPSKAKSAELETRDFGPVTLPDTGAYQIAGVDNPVRASQRIRVFRFNDVDMAGGLVGSRLRVKVRKTVEPVVVQ